MPESGHLAKGVHPNQLPGALLSGSKARLGMELEFTHDSTAIHSRKAPNRNVDTKRVLSIDGSGRKIILLSDPKQWTKMFGKHCKTGIHVGNMKVAKQMPTCFCTEFPEITGFL